MCAIDEKGCILSCQAIDISGETKTLGGQVARAEYAEQYIGKDASLTGVDAISGATITSNAYADCVRTAFAALAQIQEAQK